MKTFMSPDAVAAIRQLSLKQVEKRLAELDGERAVLSLLRRSLVARRNAELRTARRSVHKGDRQ
jgi:hypothetical protein